MSFLRNPPSWIVVILALMIILFGFMGFGFVSIFLSTSAVLIFSSTSVFFSFSKHKPESESVQNLFVSRLDQNFPLHDSFEEIVQKAQESETRPKENLPSTSLVVSEQSKVLNDTALATSEDSEVDGSFGDGLGRRSPDCSDGTISDEDSLIEIAIPSGQYVGHDKEEETVLVNYVHEKTPDHLLFGDCIFKKHNLMEFLADINEMINEEENLIEIDLSIGSIKYPRFEIEA